MRAGADLLVMMFVEEVALARAKPGRYCVSRAGIESISPSQGSAERRQICIRGFNRSRWFKAPARRLNTFGPSPVDVA